MILVARRASLLDAVKEKIQQDTSADVLIFALDVKDTQAAAKAVQDTVKRFGRIDIVVANAGVSPSPDGTRRCASFVILNLSSNAFLLSSYRRARYRPLVEHYGSECVGRTELYRVSSLFTSTWRIS